MDEPLDSSQALARRWFQKAENDLLNVQNNLQAERYASDTVCFHCQQAAEKYLKGFLVWHQTSFDRPHDLLELLEQVKQITGADDKVLANHLSLLDPYAVSICYPQAHESEPDGPQVLQAVGAAYAVRAWVRARLKSE
ncbi:MAG: HEPN domain-containing protein [Anaerolineae bacterium]|jgi:HEPN domain-containing protein